MKHSARTVATLIIMLLSLPTNMFALSDRIKEADAIALAEAEKRIVGGAEISISERPWQVGLLLSRRSDDYWAHFCGGTLIQKSWVVTAAHCVDDNTEISEFEILTSTDKLDGSGNRFVVKSIHVHPDWDKNTKANDIALVQIYGRAGIGSVISLATQEQLSAAINVTVSGWGRTRELGSRVESLQGVTFKTISNATCNRRDSYDGAVTDSMFCAGRAGGGQDSCKGDSGGPVTITVEGVQVLAGVVSWGKGCARPKKYGIYTRISHFTEWIDEQISGNPAGSSTT